MPVYMENCNQSRPYPSDVVSSASALWQHFRRLGRVVDPVACAVLET